jgi:hypothetical protein
MCVIHPRYVAPSTRAGTLFPARCVVHRIRDQQPRFQTSRIGITALSICPSRCADPGDDPKVEVKRFEPSLGIASAPGLIDDLPRMHRE